ncbi:BTB/POZ and MATH domain-containing protein 2-like [Panicum hallii]|nr:BTB/POZ and MATH domain-containing protein 2-like [Panicum hallii]
MPISASSATTGDGGGGSTSTIAAETTSGWHELRVPGYATTKGGVGKFINSATFVVGGHSWYIRYYPDGNNEKSAGWVSVYLYLDLPAAGGDGDVKARYKLSLIDDDDAGEDLSSYTRTSAGYSFWGPGKPRGYHQFIKGTDMESSLKGHGFRIRCDVTVMKETCVDTTVVAGSLAVPPPELHRHLGALLDSEVGGDLTFDVGGEHLTAHRYVLAARSPVLMAELFGPMKENTTGSIRISDVEPRVFKAMLRFVYTDSLPEVDDEDSKVGMAQHLLVVADRYGLPRLMVMCEATLLEHIDTSVVATTLTLAEQHGCHGLKEGCFWFMRTPGNTKAVMASEGFQHLRTSCPFLIEEMLAKLAS